MAAIIIVDFQNSCFIFILMSLFSLLCYSLFFRKHEVGYELPPSPPSLPIIRHLHHLLSGVFHKSLHKFSSKYGPILHLRIFNFPIVLVSSASVTYEIFKAQDVKISTRNLCLNEGSLFFGPLGFVSAPYGDYWKFMKKLIVTKLLGPQALERSRGIRADEVERFYSVLLDKAMRKESVEIVEEAMKLINKTMCKIIMGRSCSDETAEKVRGLVIQSDALMKKFYFAAFLRTPLAKLGISLFKTDFDGISGRFDKVLEKILMNYEEKQDGHYEGNDMMDALLEASGDGNITRNHIKTLFVDLFVAGTDTTMHTTEWIMAELMSNPMILERLREEIDSVVGKTRLIQETDLPNLPYLQATVKEGLRLHPPIPVMPRAFQEGCNIGSFYVPENTRLLVNVYSVMRDPDFWEDPEEFKPERFLALEQQDNVREEVLKYIPFGGGRRGCPASNLASLTVGTVIGVMVQGFDWKTNGDKVNMEEARGVASLSMAYPLKCSLVPRTLNLLTSSL